jgi:hypothetical protein
LAHGAIAQAKRLGSTSSNTLALSPGHPSALQFRFCMEIAPWLHSLASGQGRNEKKSLGL